MIQRGVYAPITTTFQDEDAEIIDLDAFTRSVVRLANAGVGILLGGTLGEGPLLSRDERNQLTRCARLAIQNLPRENHVSIIVGVVGQSVSECVAMAKDAAEAGADAIIVVAPAYFAFVYGKDKVALKGYFETIADESPLPVMLYNIPFAAGGIDMTADFLIDISEHQNIVGVKLTCQNIAKGQCVALHVNTPEYRARHPQPFLVLPGSTEYLLPALIARQHGCIGGPANLYPKTCVKIYRLGVEGLGIRDMSKLEEAQRLQDLVTRADSVINRVGFLGIKTALALHVDKEVKPVFRKPLVPMGESSIRDIRAGLAEIMAVENSL